MGAFVFSEFGLPTQIDKKAGKNVRGRVFVFASRSGLVEFSCKML